MDTKQSLVHNPLVLTALTIEAADVQTSYRSPKSRLHLNKSVEQDDVNESWKSNHSDNSKTPALIQRVGIFSQALPRSIPRQFITDAAGESNRYAIYILTKRPLCSCSISRMLHTVSSDARGTKALSGLLGSQNDFSIILAPGYDFSGPAEPQSCQSEDNIRKTPPETYTLADVLAHHFTLLATGTRQLALGRFLILVHENWFVNGLLLVEFDVSCSPITKTHIKNNTRDDSSTPSGEGFLTEDFPTPTSATLTNPLVSKRTKSKRSNKSGRLGFLRVGADWAENAIRLLRADASNWAELKEVEMTAEWADGIQGYTGTKWQTMGLEGYSDGYAGGVI